MINIEYMTEKYSKIIFFGAMEKLLHKYLPYIRMSDCIVDSDIKKQGKIILGLEIQSPQILIEEKFKDANIAVVILPLAYEKDIYTTVRRIGFKGDVYADDMISFEKNEYADNKYIITNGAYTIEKHTQLLISLLKEYGIKNIIVSPGVCNMNFVHSVQYDSYFKLWSCIDERSAAYMACGMAQTINEPVVLSCTGATASRNYMSALTEAFYSHIPIIAVTSSRDSFMIGNGIEQVTDRLHLPADIVKESVELTTINTLAEKKYCELKINRALLATKIHGGGPVHINLITHFEKDFSTRTLPKCNKIEVICANEEQKFPKIEGKIAIYIRPGTKLTDSTTKLIDLFCEKYDGVVIGDHLSNYKGQYFVNFRLISLNNSNKYKFDLLIYTGTINSELNVSCEKSWRLSTDGKVEDIFLNLEYLFDMDIEMFFKYYVSNDIRSIGVEKKDSLFYILSKEYHHLVGAIKELPFSNMWIAKELSSKIPKNSVCYFGIYSTLRNWNYFELDKSVNCYSTVGGYGIDGTLSAMLGASYINTENIHFCFLGDLSFFYDLNSIGNRHIGNNVRIMVINNNGGNSLLHSNGLPDNLGKDSFIGARNHFKNEMEKTNMIKFYAEALGFKYLLANNKEEFLLESDIFLRKSDMPILFEIKYPECNDFEAVDSVKNT